jgi:hypothetical protein
MNPIPIHYSFTLLGQKLQETITSKMRAIQATQMTKPNGSQANLIGKSDSE